jgi:predicted DNA-binding protein
MTQDRLKRAVEAAKVEAKRARTVAVRLTGPEFDRLQRVAKAQGIAASTLARVLITASLEDLEERKN